MTTEQMTYGLDDLSDFVSQLEELAAKGELRILDAPRLVEVIQDLVALAQSLSADAAAYKALLPSEQVRDDIEELCEMASEMSLDYFAAYGRVLAWLESLEEDAP